MTGLLHVRLCYSGRVPIHPHLLVLRSLVTVEISLLIGQAGWASAGLGRDPGWFGMHALFALPTLVFTVVTLAGYLVLRRTAGPVCLSLAVAQTLAVLSQYGLGEAGVRDVHIFLGVLTVMVCTALTSWTYRLPPPDQPKRPEM